MTIGRAYRGRVALAALMITLSTAKGLAAGTAPEAAPPEPQAKAAPEPQAKAAAASKTAAIFPATVSAKYAHEKPGTARRHTCLDQYHANKTTNGNGGLNWIQKGGGYSSVCLKKLKS